MLPRDHMTSSSIAFLIVLLIVLPVFVRSVEEYRTFNGDGNNRKHLTWGKTGTNYLRGSLSVDYEDSHSSMRKDLPSSRIISNALFGTFVENPSNRKPRSDFVTFWGQFLAHDITLTTTNQSDIFHITIPVGDPWFDPQELGNRTLRFSRAVFDQTSNDNPRQIKNFASHFVDGSMIYGHDESRARMLRSFRDGKLNTSTIIINGKQFVMMPRNTIDLSNANDAGFAPNDRLYLAGDVRANENPALASLHTIFLREHNRLCDELKKKHSNWNDEKLYQEARRWVIAFIQAITFNEYTIATLGEPLPTYNGYNESMNPSIDIFFVGSSFRYGHSEVNPMILRLDERRREIDEKHLFLRESFFNPSWSRAGIDPILRGIAYQRQQEVDTFYINDIRNFLFGRTPESGALDLASLNIQRGRDFGLPSLNEARKYYGLSEYTSFSQITSNQEIALQLQNVYGTIDRVDSYVGGLAEDHKTISNLGPLFTESVKKQYTALRDGDRFYYRNRDAGFSEIEIIEIESTKLANIILRNSDIKAIQCNVFELSDNLDCRKDETSIVAPDNVISLLNDQLKIKWRIEGDEISFEIEAKTPGWVAIGFSKYSNPSMLGSDVIIASIDANGVFKIDDFFVGNQRAQGCPQGICRDTEANGQNDILSSQGTKQNDVTFVSFRRKINTGDERDVAISMNNPVPMIYAMGEGTVDNIQHHGSNKGGLRVNFATGTTKISNDILNQRITHGVLMIIGWAICMTTGTLIARYGKRLFGKYWLQAHLMFQIPGLAIVIVSFVIAIMMTHNAGDTHFRDVHQIFGLITFVSAILQTMIGEAANTTFDPRRPKPFVFDVLHWIVGYAALILSVVTSYLGFWALGNVPAIIWVIYSVWILVLVVTWVVLWLLVGTTYRCKVPNLHVNEKVLVELDEHQITNTSPAESLPAPTKNLSSPPISEKNSSLREEQSPLSSAKNNKDSDCSKDINNQ